LCDNSKYILNTGPSLTTIIATTTATTTTTTTTYLFISNKVNNKFSIYNVLKQTLILVREKTKGLQQQQQ
jgi:hypothetical protein